MQRPLRGRGPHAPKGVIMTVSDVAEIEVLWRADFQSGSRVQIKVL